MILINSISPIHRSCFNKYLSNSFSISHHHLPTSSRFICSNFINSNKNRCFYSSSSSGQHKQNVEWRQRVVGAQTNHNLKVGPYKRGRWFVSYKEDPGSFITNILIILVTGYAIFTLLPGESMKVRRQRKLRQMLLDKANLTEAELNYIENYKLDSEDKV